MIRFQTWKTTIGTDEDDCPRSGRPVVCVKPGDWRKIVSVVNEACWISKQYGIREWPDLDKKCGALMRHIWEGK